MRILLIEDDKQLCDTLSFQLMQEHYEVDICHDGRDGLDLFLQDAYDLVLLDRMLPTMNGLLVLKKAREAGIRTPVIVLTALGELYDRIEGLDCGADDYMVKPFLPKELSLRIGIILRRYYKGEDPIVQLAGSRIDFDRAEVIKENEHFPLTAKEHDILLALYRNAGRIVTIDQLCEAAWGDNPYGYENSLMAHIRRIREKIEANPSKPVSLITVKGLGYKLVLTGK